MIGKTEKVHVASGFKLIYDGVFDLDRLYSEIRSWFDEYLYGFEETKHSDKVKAKGREIEYVFKGSKEINDYVKYGIKATFFLEEVNPVSGNLVKAKAVVNFEGTVETDYRDRWQKTKFMEFLFRFYNNYLVKDEIQRQKGRLYKEIIALHDLAKDILEFNR